MSRNFYSEFACVNTPEDLFRIVRVEAPALSRKVTQSPTFDDKVEVSCFLSELEMACGRLDTHTWEKKRGV